MGIVLTLFLQYEQFRLQHRELQRLEKASEENKDALNTQRREQFLAARLNATIALLQATEIEAKAAQFAGDLDREGFADESLKLRQQVSILLAESDLAFDHSIPSDRLEVRSINNYLNNIANQFKVNYDNNLHPGGSLQSLVTRFAREVSSLVRLLAHRHPEISQTLDSEWNDFYKIYNQKGDVEAWFDRFLSKTLKEMPFTQ